jgi:methylated-DNA-[protein]-cysteine S-methyltransferase
VKLRLSQIASPIGNVLIISDGEALRALDFEDYEARMHELLRLHYGAYTLAPEPHSGALGRRMQAYFEGDLTAIEDIPTRTGGTPFQRQVWAELRLIPAGTTTTYGALAARCGRPKASRAIGLANGSNPVSVVVPCHRVIGANAKLTGYGGGLHRKEWLIAHERQYAPHAQPRFAFA